MANIIANISSLIQHLKIVSTNPDYYRSDNCPNCGKCGVWHHGHYKRKADRGNSDNPNAESLNPIPILRFFCNHCKTTHSVLPECIPPRRWYIWLIQQIVILGLCSGNKLKSISKNIAPARSTCRRWWLGLQKKFALHRDALCIKIYQLGSFETVDLFWQLCLQKITLAKAMYFCNEFGVVIP